MKKKRKASNTTLIMCKYINNYKYIYVPCEQMNADRNMNAEEQSNNKTIINKSEK